MILRQRERSTTTVMNHDIFSKSNHHIAVAAGLLIFLALVLAIAASNFCTLFWDLHGWKHRLSGGVLLIWLVVGCGITILQHSPSLSSPSSSTALILYYDIILGCMGLTATLTAARDFPHRYISNSTGQSGSLSESAVVTHAEMIEHAFYQGLNLFQAIYLHFLATATVKNGRGFWLQRWIALFAVTVPCLARSRFPVHSFSHNWNKSPVNKRTAYETFMYKIKKAQYLFYKHVILHGVNMTVYLAEASQLVKTPAWRIFWICLNTAYVMEFFFANFGQASRNCAVNHVDYELLTYGRFLCRSCAVGSICRAMGSLCGLLCPKPHSPWTRRFQHNDHCKYRVGCLKLGRMTSLLQ